MVASFFALPASAEVLGCLAYVRCVSCEEEKCCAGGCEKKDVFEGVGEEGFWEEFDERAAFAELPVSLGEYDVVEEGEGVWEEERARSEEEGE